jgi:hypothetical protein
MGGTDAKSAGYSWFAVFHGSDRSKTRRPFLRETDRHDLATGDNGLQCLTCLNCDGIDPLLTGDLWLAGG